MRIDERLAEDRRQILLAALHEATGVSLNETVLRVGLNSFGHRIGRDMVRTELAWLAEQRLIRIERIPNEGDELWVAFLCRAGAEIIELGRRHPGVAVRSPT